jgi:hypothetical protein
MPIVGLRVSVNGREILPACSGVRVVGAKAGFADGEGAFKQVTGAVQITMLA